ncbi:hypothetical protein I7I51_06241 [Histoplasma capsulatum]|uniref:Uncharacterized protein n=1 Tax=Ajellomyces capsulatus TaxID=5037 RepID=A0A8A1MFJ7_AJECA|nr:hypothetical protein I7I51_06241 [Histoplasma capsulatum]
MTISNGLSLSRYDKNPHLRTAGDRFWANSNLGKVLSLYRHLLNSYAYELHVPSSQSGWNPNPQTFQPLEKAQRCEHVPHVQLSTLTIYLFGLSTLHLGIYNYLHPRNALTSLDLPLSSLHSINATSTATIAMGLYYTLAAYQWNSVFYMLTALMRLLTTSVFWTHAQPGVSRRGWKAGVDVGVQSWAG